MILGAALVAVTLAAAALARPARAQDLDELIRMRVEQLQGTGTLELRGVTLAARNLIPDIYEARAFAPAWRSVAQIDSLLGLIEESYREGLDPADYHAEVVRSARDAFAHLDKIAPEARADFDLVLTDAFVRLGYHLRFGKVDPVALDTDWNFDRNLAGSDAVATISAAIEGASMSEFAARTIPRTAAYRRLVDALARYRAIDEAGGWPTVPQGPTLKTGMEDPRVPEIAARLAATGDIVLEAASHAGLVYDETLAAGVRRFQARHGLTADGVLGPATRNALAVPVGERIEQLRVNLERARWVSDELPSDYVSVNIAAFELELVRAGAVAWTTRVVVGQPYRRTPVFKATMRYLVFNPTWTVPPTVFTHDILPELRRNPGYLASHGIEAIGANGAPVDPASVDWSSRRNFPFRLVQEPGPDNALGRVKFMFPNDHFVYLHDTPHRELFSRETRAFSSGCIRVEDPLELARRLLGPKWSAEKIDSLIAAGRTETVFLEQPIAVLLLYSTAEVDEDGTVRFLPDIYARDPAVSAALGTPFSAHPAL